MKNWPLQKRRTRRKNVGQAAGGGSLLIEGLYRDHFKDLCRNIHKSFGGGPPEPEEVVQAAFTKFASLENPERIAEPRSFLFITARNRTTTLTRNSPVAPKGMMTSGCLGTAALVQHPRSSPRT